MIQKAGEYKIRPFRLSKNPFLANAKKGFFDNLNRATMRGFGVGIYNFKRDKCRGGHEVTPKS